MPALAPDRDDALMLSSEAQERADSKSQSIMPAESRSKQCKVPTVEAVQARCKTRHTRHSEEENSIKRWENIQSEDISRHTLQDSHPFCSLLPCHPSILKHFSALCSGLTVRALKCQGTCYTCAQLSRVITSGPDTIRGSPLRLQYSSSLRSSSACKPSNIE